MGLEIEPLRRPVPAPDQPWLTRNAWPSSGIEDADSASPGG